MITGQPMKFSDYATMDAIALSAAIRRSHLSAQKVTDTAIEVARQMNERLNAVLMTNYDNARLRASEELPDTPAAGSPLRLKDVNQFTFGKPSTYSCRF